MGLFLYPADAYRLHKFVEDKQRKFAAPFGYDNTTPSTAGFLEISYTNGYLCTDHTHGAKYDIAIRTRHSTFTRFVILDDRMSLDVIIQALTAYIDAFLSICKDKEEEKEEN